MTPTSNPPVVVVGAVNIDIGGQSAAPLVPGDSNPGKVRLSLGGVGRNIAHNMALLGLNVTLITALGQDAHAHTVATSCRDLGIDLSHALTVEGGSTSSYLFLTGPDGDMALAVSDMAIYSHLTPEFLETKREVLSSAALVVAETNLPQQTLNWLAEHCPAPLFVDPVSTAKAKKLAPILGRIHTLKPNRLEAELLSGVPITDRASLETAAQRLLDTGLQRLFVSLGEEGVYVALATGERHLEPCLAVQPVNTTGAGDAFLAALAWAWQQGLSLELSAQAGVAASAIALEGAETINPSMSVLALCDRSPQPLVQLTAAPPAED